MLAIRLENDTLYLHGTPEESAGTEIRGCLELSFKENTRVKSIHLEFTGLLKLNWEEDTSKRARRRLCKVKKTVYQHQWTFLSSKTWPRTMNADTIYRYPFDLALPGDMAESIEQDCGSLVYAFKAVVTRPLSAKKWVVHRPIHVIRSLQQQPQPQQQQPHPSIFGMADDGEWLDSSSRVINRTFGDKVEYRIEMDKPMYQRGQPIRIQFTFTPLIQGLRLKHVSCFLKEYTTMAHPIHPGSTTLEEYDTNRIVSLVRDEQFPCYGHQWQRTETVVIPRSSQVVHYDTTHPLIRIRHKLRFTVCFVQPHGQLSELRVTMPVQLVGMASTENTASIDCLPRYEDACLSIPYHPQRQLWATSSSASLPSLVSHPMCPSPSYDSLENDYNHMATPPDNIAINPPCDYFSYQPADQVLHHIPSNSIIPL